MRLFAALPLPRDVSAALGKGLAKARELYPRIHWVREEKMHLTLHFFGDLPDDCVQYLYHVFENDATLARTPIPMRLGLPGKFPEKGPPKVLWVGLDKGREDLQEYWRLFETKLIPLHLQPDPEGFSPHVTVARAGKASVDAGWVDFVQVPRIDFKISELVLYQSVLGQSGVNHVAQRRVPFKEAQA
jgi:RNA 2',3'-cyclic 3'-phosphodiesterase